MKRVTIEERQRRSTGTTTLFERVEPDVGFPLFVVTCITHDETIEADGYKHGEYLATRPFVFCDKCAKIARTREKLERARQERARLTPKANEGVCDPSIGCGAFKNPTIVYGNLDAPYSEWVRVCKDCAKSKETRQLIVARFEPFTRSRSEDWEGPDKNERQMLNARHGAHQYRIKQEKAEKRGEVVTEAVGH